MHNGRGKSASLTRLSAVASLAIAGIGLAGCASELAIYDAQNRPAMGVPFNAPELYVRSFQRNAHSKGGDCRPVTVYQTVALPAGERFYANVDPAEFASTEFSISFAENGVMTGISMNSDPQIDETVGAAAELVAAVVPLFTGGAAAAAAAGEGEESAAAFMGADARKACDAGESSVSYCRFAEWDNAAHQCSSARAVRREVTED